MKKDFSSFLVMLKASLDLSGRRQTPTLLTPMLLCAPESFLTRPFFRFYSSVCVLAFPFFPQFPALVSEDPLVSSVALGHLSEMKPIIRPERQLTKCVEK